MSASVSYRILTYLRSRVARNIFFWLLMLWFVLSMNNVKDFEPVYYLFFSITFCLMLALTYINNIRTRAWGNTNGNISQGELTLQFVLDERARELYWEGHRRTDLVRYGQLTTNTYIWPWKGGVASGTAVDAKYNLFPIPASVLSSNPNLTQNPGY